MSAETSKTTSRGRTPAASKKKSSRVAAVDEYHQREFRAQRVFDVLRELRRASYRHLYDEIYGSGKEALEPAQYDALELLLTEAEWRMTDFAKALRVDPSTATRMVDRLVKAGVAVRAPSRIDGRGIIVRGTRAGRLRRVRVGESRREIMHEFLRVFDDKELDQLIELMERLADRMATVADERAAEEEATTVPARKAPSKARSNGASVRKR